MKLTQNREIKPAILKDYNVLDIKLNMWVNLGGSVSKKFFFVKEGKPNYTFSSLELQGAGSSQCLHWLDIG